MRKYLPSVAELIDRLSIDTLKEVFIPEQKKHYRKEIADIKHDINDQMFASNLNSSSIDMGKLIHAIIVISQMNAHIWYNEAEARKGRQQDLKKLKLTHGLNGIRSRAKNKLLDTLGIKTGKDYKTDCLAAEFKDWDVEL